MLLKDNNTLCVETPSYDDALTLALDLDYILEKFLNVKISGLA